jgi:hypothetical protein
MLANAPGKFIDSLIAVKSEAPVVPEKWNIILMHGSATICFYCFHNFTFAEMR